MVSAIDTNKAAILLRGKSISRGLSSGILYSNPGIRFHSSRQVPSGGVEYELARLEVANGQVFDDLSVLSERVEREINGKYAEIFDAQIAMIGDTLLQNEIRKEITTSLVSASWAVKTVLLRWESRLLLSGSQMAKDKCDDMKDISYRYRDVFSGISVNYLDNLPVNCVLVLDRLLPSDAINLTAKSVSAVLLQYGAPGSHAALFVREMELPAISGIPNLTSTIVGRDWALVDADRGEVTVNPSLTEKKAFKIRCIDRLAEMELARANAHQKAATIDGMSVHVESNISGVDEARKAVHYGADGIGLYRTERHYLGRSTPPSRGQLIDEMRNVLFATRKLTVNIRLLDFGADKSLSYLSFLSEKNPALGRRGVRFLFDNPELLETQLSAILEVSKSFNVRILIPMVTVPGDVQRVKEVVHKIAREMGVDEVPKIGAMIEVPAAALSACEISKHVDFMCFGTNDLAQYSFAADRDSVAVEEYFDDSSDVIFRLLSIVHGDVRGMPLSLCGDLAARPEFVARLLQCGIKSFSVSPALVPIIKQVVRGSKWIS
ncbi:phosphoenolpyruvate--protein phosphotransferase [Simiduia agarivorans]|uniref:Phosphoenolpyruvate-protein phosphotransferase n=1 Tax=Simiduia agarivorans (strain DSM 21679 / JCM 13881 / BCRC 17597 / SA1) TaxID=1117647 RepID=K4KHQ2_SIMAS|nr:phosphoenolpyruvate--protein phosphotransferase [Simiduia agarivorans]AFU97498.1 phosphoenolpyruvate--protein phosphotransferase [Simiduia agarivorans SA1 = DSM 21679]